MSLPASLLARLPVELRQNSLIRSGASLENAGRGRRLDRVHLQEEAEVESSAAEEVLRGEIEPGAVVELALTNGASLGTALALAACRRRAEASRARGERPGLSAFVDPSASLYAPGMECAGVDPSRVLVVRPDPLSLGRVAVRLAESRVFSLLVIDLVGSPQAPLDVALGPWVRIVRRMTLAVAESEGSILLLTDRDAPRPLPLPVTQRLELARVTPKELLVRVSKESRGRLEGPRRIVWTRPGSEPRPEASVRVRAREAKVA